MKTRRTVLIAVLLATVVLVVLANSCSNVKNTTSFAVLTGHIYTSPEQPYGVEGVRVWVESDSESELPYYGGDVTVNTNEEGEYYVTIFLGFITEDSGQGGFGFDPEQPQYVGDARMICFYEDLYFDLGGGISLEMGQTIKLPDLYLSQFAEFAGPPN